MAAVRVASTGADELVNGAVIPATDISIDALKPQGGAIDVAAVAGPRRQGRAGVGHDRPGRVPSSTGSIADALIGPVASGDRPARRCGRPAQALARRSRHHPAGAAGGARRRRAAQLPDALPEQRRVARHGRQPSRDRAAQCHRRQDHHRAAGVQHRLQHSRRADHASSTPRPPPSTATRSGASCPTSRSPPTSPRPPSSCRAYWAESFGTTIDGVLSFDPVALSYLLGATGPVTLPPARRSPPRTPCPSC